MPMDIRVAAHAHGVEGMQLAIRAGVASIEHGSLMDADTMRLMKKHGTYLVPTILAGEFVTEKARDRGIFSGNCKTESGGDWAQDAGYVRPRLQGGGQDRFWH